MRRLHQSGHINSLFMPLLLTIVAFLSASGFGLWAFMERQEYKNQADKKIAAAVAVAKQQTTSEKDAEFAEKEKSPTKTYTGPEAYGSITFSYPKTWSALIVEDKVGSTNPINSYFYPDYLPGVNLPTISYALRVRVLSASYDKTLASYANGVKSGALQAQPFSPEKVPSVVGVRLDGEISTKKQGTSIILPLRDRTIEIFTESSEYLDDFETFILPTLTYQP